MESCHNLLLFGDSCRLFSGLSTRRCPEDSEKDRSSGDCLWVTRVDMTVSCAFLLPLIQQPRVILLPNVVPRLESWRCFPFPTSYRQYLRFADMAILADRGQKAPSQEGCWDTRNLEKMQYRAIMGHVFFASSSRRPWARETACFGSSHLLGPSL